MKKTYHPDFELPQAVEEELGSSDSNVYATTNEQQSIPIELSRT